MKLLWMSVGQVVNVILDGEGALSHLGETDIETVDGVESMVAFLDNGTTGGNPSMVMAVFNAFGDGVALELTVRQLQMIAAAARGRFGEVP